MEPDRKLADLFDLSDSVLGTGGFSEVKKAQRISDGTTVAVKIINALDEFDKAAVQNEISTMTILGNHDNIVKFYDYYEEESNYYLVLEYMSGGDLFDKIVEKNYYTEKDARDVFHSILVALKHCHDLKILHRDIKPENMLFDNVGSHGNLKLADFGTAIQLLSHMKSFTKGLVGSPPYMSPEVCRGSNYSFEADVWSAGVVLYTILFGYPPFDEDSERKLFGKIQAGDYVFPDNHEVSREARDLIMKMLCLDPFK